MFFQSFYYACGGAIMYRNGGLIRIFWENDDQKSLHQDSYNLIVELTGAGIAMLFYVRPDYRYNYKYYNYFTEQLHYCFCSGYLSYSGLVSGGRAMTMKMLKLHHYCHSTDYISPFFLKDK